MIEKSKTGIKKKLDKISENMEKHKKYKTKKFMEDLIKRFKINFGENQITKASLSELQYLIDNSKTKFMEDLIKKFKTKFGKNQIILEKASLSELQYLIDNIGTSEKRGVFVEIKNQIAKVKDEKLHYLPLPNKSDTDLFGALRDDIIKICNILVEIENEIKRTNEMAISLESFVRKIALESNIIKMEEKTISQKIKGLDAGIEHISDMSTDIYKTLLKTPSISTKEVPSTGLPIPYIIFLSLSTAVFVFCGVSLYVNIFMAKTLFDPYLSLFWFLGGLGIGLMSLKGIFSWGKNEKK